MREKVEEASGGVGVKPYKSKVRKGASEGRRGGLWNGWMGEE